MYHVVNALRYECFNIFNPLTPSYLIEIFTNWKLCLADTIYKFNWVRITQILQNRDQLFLNIADWFHAVKIQI